VSSPGDADPDVAALLRRLAGTGVRELHRIGRQHHWGHYRVVLADGREAFAKVAGAGATPGAGLDGIFEAEARGLRWLADAGAVPLPGVLGWDARALAVSWLPAEAPRAAAAERFGRDLARMHLAGSARFGAPWRGFIASLPLGSGAAGGAGGDEGDSWPEWYASERLLPYARRACDAGALAGADVRLIEAVAGRIGELAGPAEPPSRIHGDCWSGNLLWSGGRGWLIDPAAHGGHRETDLAMLALFGAPYLDRIMAAYQEIAPLAPGWRARVPLHQLHPLLVHVCLFGTGYRDAALQAARSALQAARPTLEPGGASGPSAG
jgi:fructosamine-3-kinase